MKTFGFKPSLFLAVAAAPFAAWAGGQSAKLSMDPNGAWGAKMGYYPIALPVSLNKPAQVTKEPAYQAKPQYGVIKLGDGPNSEFVFAADEPEAGDWKIYIDKNRNGDLTDDGDGSWGKKTQSNGRTQYGVLSIVLRASYGTAKRETSSADYGLALYCFSNRPAPFMARKGLRTGSLTIDGKKHKIMLAENDADGIYSKPVSTVDEAAKHRPVWLAIDLNDDDKYSSGYIDIRAPFKIGDSAYEADVAKDGSSIKLSPTKKAVLDLGPKAAPAPPLLKPGTAAPEFAAEKWGGGDLKLSDYRGKVVVIDFWATWCGPCMKAMPHVASVSKALQGQDVVVLGVCVWDEKSAYNDWVKQNMSIYPLQFAFDPAGSDNAKSIAAHLFNVSGIPTTYVIDKDGKVAAAIVGFEDGDKRLEEELKKLGVKVG